MTLTIDKLSVSRTPDPKGPEGENRNPAPAVFTLDQLAISPLNVRFNEEDCAAVEALSASIVAEGLLQPLVLHPVPKGAKWANPLSKDATEGAAKTVKYGVLAGGRRYRAIRRAIEAGELPSDFPIAATVRDLSDGAILLLSLSENLLRRSLRPYEEQRAVALAHAEGLSVDQIAAQIGQTRRWVEQQLRMGELHPEIFAAYVAGSLSADQAMAFAATADRELQAEAWAHFRPLLAYERTPVSIRAFMRVGDRELARQLLFVGEALYRGNGGTFELDLFADGPDAMRGRVTDEPLLRKLAEEKMEVLRGQVRDAWEMPGLRFQREPPAQQHGQYSSPLEITLPRDSKALGKKAGWLRVRAPAGADPADLVGTIEIGQDGNWSARLWWANRKARAAFEKTSSPRARAGGTLPAEEPTGSIHTPTAGEALEHTAYYPQQEAKRLVREEHGLTADGINVVRTIRRDLLRFALLHTPERDVPGDYLTWSALRQALARDRASRTGARGLAAEGWTEGEREPAELMKDQRDGQEGFAFWEDRLAILRDHPAFAGEDPAASLRAYFSASPALKRTAEAVLAGLALIRTAAAPGWNAATHGVLVEALGFTPEGLRNAWAPTAAFTGLFGKLARQEMVAPFVDEGERRALAKARDKPLSARTAAILAAQRDWLHPLLAFDPPPWGVAAPELVEGADGEGAEPQPPEPEPAR